MAAIPGSQSETPIWPNRRTGRLQLTVGMTGTNEDADRTAGCIHTLHEDWK